MNVSAVIVTRGNVALRPVLDSLPPEWEVVIWNNGIPNVSWYRQEGRGGGISGSSTSATDLSVYGRYAAIEHATHDLIYVQDDDVIVSDPQAIVRTWVKVRQVGLLEHGDDSKPYIVANMPEEFRHDGYTDSCLVGFGACFHRDLPERSFSRLDHRIRGMAETNLWFQRTCDVVFTTLTPRVLVDVPKTNREFAEDPDRMYRQPDHVGERARMLKFARMVRDA